MRMIVKSEDLATTASQATPELRLFRRGPVIVLQQAWITTVYDAIGQPSDVIHEWRDVPVVDDGSK